MRGTFSVCPSTACTGAGPVAANVCPDEITQCRQEGGGGGHQGGLPPMEKRELGAWPSLSSSAPPDSVLLSCSRPYETSQYREGAQANKQVSWSVCVYTCVRKSTEIEEYTYVCVCVGGNYHGEKTCSDFLHQNLGRRSKQGSYCWKTPSPSPVHTGKRSWINTHPHTHKHRCTQSSTFLPSAPTLLLSNFSGKLCAAATSSFQSHN